MVALCAGLAGHAFGTGYFGPDDYLSRWKNLAETPEFYWELEVKRMAGDYHPPEKLALVPRTRSGDDGRVDTAPMTKATADADAADFKAAIQGGQIKPPDAQAAQKQHADARSFVEAADEKTAGPLTAEFDSEFADYERGAFAFRQGKDHWDEARKAWLALLDRPAAERHYRTVWAAFMLGKLAIDTGDPEAAAWFEKTRQFAAQGFADSLGMAADSYGWEGRADWKQGHPEKAAPMYLTQLALGDVSAVVSLKALIPDRDSLDGMLNYGDAGVELYPGKNGDGSTPPTDEQKKAAEPKLIEKLKVMAADPLLRKLETVHVLATESGLADSMGSPGPVRSQRWLRVLAEVKPGKVEEAEYLGWMAYTMGNYKEAERWLDLSAGETPVANWLRARLELRAGKTAEAAASMEKAWAGIRDKNGYTGWNKPLEGDEQELYLVPAEDEGLSMQEWMNGDVGAVRLMRSDFVQSMDTFLKGGLWEDAAYVAERVLTTDELKAYVDKMPPAAAKPSDQHAAQTAGFSPDATDGGGRDTTASMRCLLGRRLVREDRSPEADAYMPAAYGKLLDNYAGALKDGADAGQPKAKRAAAWSTAAWMARHDGMELMGTEVAPDGFDSDGAFENPDVAKARLSGVAAADADEGTPATPLAFRAEKPEAARLKKNVIRPDIRFHYRIIAAALAVRAAALMEDNTEELADALNTAGLWVKDRDEKLGNQYYQIIEKRCAKTKIGKDVIAKHWFVDETGPWCAALDAASQALHKELGIQNPG